MHKYVIMGIQGCGKGTQAKMLAGDFDLIHIGVGEIFRWHIQSHTKLAARIGRFTSAGELVPDDIVEEIVRARLDQHDWNYGFFMAPKKPSGGTTKAPHPLNRLGDQAGHVAGRRRFDHIPQIGSTCFGKSVVRQVGERASVPVPAVHVAHVHRGETGRRPHP